MAEELKVRLEEFNTNLPLISALRNPGLRERHWMKLSSHLGYELKADDSFSVASAIQMRLNEHLQV